MTPHTSPEETLDQVRRLAPDQTLIVDLDHTLHLSSSTEQFVDAARPASLAATGLAALEILRPWRISPDPPASRDRMRMLFVVVFFPWTVLLWRRRVRSDAGWNQPLLEAVAAHPGEVVVASNGFRIAVAPRIRQVLPDATMVARSLLANSPTATDKLTRATSALGEETITKAAVVTDSRDDAALLEACGSPHLTQWPDSFWNRAHSDAYVPLQYSAAKHSRRSLVWTLVLDDLPLILVVVAVGSESPVRSTLAASLILLSSRFIYDWGYNENDHLSVSNEPEKTLRSKAIDHKDSVPPRAVVGWATTFAAVAVVIADPADLIAPFQSAPMRRSFAFASIVLMMMALRLVFAAFNRLPPSRRPFVHPVLQACRYGIFAAAFSISAVGIAALISQAVFRVTPYAIYRSRRSRGTFPDGRWSLIRLGAFVLVAPLTWPWSDAETATAVAVFAWFLLRSRRDLKSLLLRRH